MQQAPDPVHELETNLERILAAPLVERLVVLVLGLVVIAFLIRLVRSALAREIESASLRYRTRKVVTTTGYFIAVLFVAAVFSEQLGGLGVAFGVAGAGVVIALGDVIVSLAGWVAITFGSFYRPGDRVLLGGVKGDVIDIGVLRTTLFEIGEWIGSDLYSGRFVRVPNAAVLREPAYNYSGDFPFVWDEIAVPVRHGSDRKLARELLEGIAGGIEDTYVTGAKARWASMNRRYLLSETRIEPAVTLTMDANWLTYTVRYVVDYKKRRATRDVLTERILDAFETTGGRVVIAAVRQEVVVQMQRAPDEGAA